MEEEGIGLVLAKASELRSKITNCLDKASSLRTQEHEAIDRELPRSFINVEEGNGAEKEDYEEAEFLLHIRDALESLETQLSSLQGLKQQQLYEKEAALAEIDYSRKMLLKKLKEYKGDELEVIEEAAVFAGESVEHNNDLLLPPYPSRPPRSLVLDSGYPSHFPSTHKSARNGIVTGDATDEAGRSLGGSERNQTQADSKNSRKGLGLFISSATKTVLTLAGVISVLILAGFEPRLKKRDTPPKFLGLFQQPATEEKRTASQCPPGKVLVVENGENRCLVKERVEVPFESVVATPDVNYGCG